MATEELIVTVCMGSSCFSQGSNEIVSVIEGYIEDQDDSGIELKLRGCLCKARCTDGPIVEIGGKEYSKVCGDSVIDILKEHILILASTGE